MQKQSIRSYLSSMVIFFVCLCIADMFLLSDIPEQKVEELEKRVSMEDQLVARDLPMRQARMITASLPPPPEVIEPLSSPSVSEAQQGDNKQFDLNDRRVALTYDKLSELAKHNFQLALPDNPKNRNQLIDFLYQCVGVQFGALVYQDQHPKLMLLSENENVEYSDLLRVANGWLSHKEHKLLNAYAPNKTPVRVFPRNIDYELSRYIANSLDGRALSSFEGKYKLDKQTLVIEQIFLNGNRIENEWSLFSGHC